MKKKTGQKNLQSGQAVITAVVLFLFVSMAIVLGISRPVYREVVSARNAVKSLAGFYASESVQEDAIYRLKEGRQISTTESLQINNADAEISINDITGGKELLSTATSSDFVRKMKITLIQGVGASFNYGVQTDEGGFDIQNSALVEGSLFSNGPVTGENENEVRGDAVSAGPGGLVRGITATGTVWAHNIDDSEIDGDAHYQTITNTTVGGTMHPGSPDQATSTLPITDEEIERWKDDAEAGGIIQSPCPYQIDSNTILGPVKIACDLEIKGSPIVTIEGAVWVEGDIEFNNTPTIRVAPSLSGWSVPIIADDESNRESSSRANIQNRAKFEGEGQNSYILVLSKNNSSKLGGGTQAITVQNEASGDLLLYAGEGEIRIQNKVELKEVSAWKVTIQNNAVVRYESGMASLLFNSGPSGGYTIGGWGEI